MLASSTGGSAAAARRVFLSTILSAPVVSTLAANAAETAKEQRKYQVGLALTFNSLSLLTLLPKNTYVEISDDTIYCCFGRPKLQQWYWCRNLGSVGRRPWSEVGLSPLLPSYLRVVL